MQRKCACGGTLGPTGECESCRKKRQSGTFQRVADHPSSLNPHPFEVPPIVHEVLRSSGQPLDKEARVLMERRFGHDFSRVRTHTNCRAAESASAIDASAYTVGHHVVFASGRFKPESHEGGSLLAHELAHVVQQSGCRSTELANIRMAPLDDILEFRVKKAGAFLPLPESLGEVSQPLLQRAPRDFRAPSLRGGGGALPRSEATELLDCIRIMGLGSEAYCRQQVLGEIPPHLTHHQLSGITTPVPIDVELNPDQTASFRINRLNVVFDPDLDSSDPAMANRASTGFSLRTSPIVPWTRGGRIVSFTGPGPIEIRIRTTYGAGVRRAGSSGYGRGTTPRDVAARDTSLEFHEGQHGVDFVEFMNTHPFPRFLGRRGMTIAQFRAAEDAFVAARNQYVEELTRFSVERTDCVGTSVDQFNAANRVQTSICRQVPVTRRP
jgi:hypothetical protein